MRVVRGSFCRKWLAPDDISNDFCSITCVKKTSIRPSATVREAATRFDEHGQPRHSEERFGNLLEASFVSSRVLHELNDSCMVRWDDGYDRQLKFQDIILHGNTLRATETLTQLLQEVNMLSRCSRSRRSSRNVRLQTLTAEPSEHDGYSDSDEPLNPLKQYGSRIATLEVNQLGV